MATSPFLPHEAMLARYMLSSCVCVCMSVTFRYCIIMGKSRITQIMPHNSPGMQIFSRQRSHQNSNGITP